MMMDKVYNLYMSDPDSGKSSYLYDHYQRGLQGIMQPDRAQKAAYSAWKAGRDTIRNKK